MDLDEMKQVSLPSTEHLHGCGHADFVDAPRPPCRDWMLTMTLYRACLKCTAVGSTSGIGSFHTNGWTQLRQDGSGPM